MNSKIQTGATDRGLFVRKSSGLVRSVSTLDTLFYCIIQLAIPYVMFNFAVYAFYPGASMELATLIALAGSLAVGITYSLFSAVYPRSGGEYVFLSRVAHPFVGFVLSFVMAFWEIYYFGVNGAFAATIGLAPFFTILGMQLNSPALTNFGLFIDTSLGWFLFGLVMIAFFTSQLLKGMRTYFKVQKVALVIALVGYIIFIIALVMGSSGALNFQANYEKLTSPGSYQALIDDAVAQGLELPEAMSWPQTLDFIIWPAFSLLFAVLSVSFSGEIKDVKRGQLIAIVGANIVGGGLILLTTYFGRMAIGDTFLKAASYIGTVEPLAYPWLTALASVMGGNILLTLIINLTITILIIYVAASTAIYATRAIFAWGIDGMAPAKLAEVSETNHTPTYSILTVAVVALGCLALYSFTDSVRVLSGIAPMGVVFGGVAFVGMLFPYIKRDVYRTSPVRFEILGIPLMTITGFIGSVVMAFIVYRAFIDDTYAANSTFSLWMIGIVFAMAVVWYFVARAIRRSQGVDMDARYHEIPVE